MIISKIQKGKVPVLKKNGEGTKVFGDVTVEEQR